MSTASASDASMDSDLDSRRSCPQCSTQMSSLAHDGHKICSNSRGQECHYDNKCVECKTWSAEVFDKYIKHVKSLASKSKARKAKGERE